jgi:predicted DsbA family dithiol-disulfide isomerase
VGIEKLRQQENVTVSWSYFPLHPETPMEGKSLTELFRGREDAIEGFYQQIKSIADDYDLPYSKRDMTYNSRLAQELGAWADTQEDGEKLHDALYRAYFVDNQNIAEIEVLLTLVRQSGLDQTVAKEVLTNRLMSPEIDQHWQRAQSMGLSGVPTFVCDELFVVGHQQFDTLMRFVNHMRTLKAEAQQDFS